MVTPLQKVTRAGKLYTRRPVVEANIIELESLSRDELVTRCEIRQRTHSSYVPSECLLYFVRAMRDENPSIHFEALYKLLLERILRRLPKADAANKRTTSHTKNLIREKVIDRFVEMLVSDRQAYLDKLDYYEINFDSALKNLLHDSQSQIWGEEKRVEPLYDEETGEVTVAAERAIGGFDPFDNAAINEESYRSQLYAAIDSLPVDLRRIIEMIRQGVPIDSKEPDAVTISKTLGKSEKTIRTYRDKAYAAIRAALN